MTQFETDLNVPMQINNTVSNLAYYNLVVTKRDLHLYCVGIIPNRNFRINNVKKYFGLKGDKFKINESIINMLNRYNLGEYKPTVKAV